MTVGTKNMVKMLGESRRLLTLWTENEAMDEVNDNRSAQSSP